MAAIINQFDKRSGITYAYESISYWDKKKKQSRCKRTLIGRVDKETGEIIPTRKRSKVSWSRATARGTVLCPSDQLAGFDPPATFHHCPFVFS